MASTGKAGSQSPVISIEQTTKQKDIYTTESDLDSETNDETIELLGTTQLDSPVSRPGISSTNEGNAVTGNGITVSTHVPDTSTVEDFNTTNDPDSTTILDPSSRGSPSTETRNDRNDTGTSMKIDQTTPDVSTSPTTETMTSDTETTIEVFQTTPDISTDTSRIGSPGPEHMTSDTGTTNEIVKTTHHVSTKISDVNTTDKITTTAATTTLTTTQKTIPSSATRTKKSSQMSTGETTLVTTPVQTNDVTTTKGSNAISTSQKLESSPGATTVRSTETGFSESVRNPSKAGNVQSTVHSTVQNQTQAVTQSESSASAPVNITNYIVGPILGVIVLILLALIIRYKVNQKKKSRRGTSNRYRNEVRSETHPLHLDLPRNRPVMFDYTLGGAGNGNDQNDNRQTLNFGAASFMLTDDQLDETSLLTFAPKADPPQGPVASTHATGRRSSSSPGHKHEEEVHYKVPKSIMGHTYHFSGPGEDDNTQGENSSDQTEVTMLDEQESRDDI